MVLPFGVEVTFDDADEHSCGPLAAPDAATVTATYAKPRSYTGRFPYGSIHMPVVSAKCRSFALACRQLVGAVNAWTSV
jgi:hypothetical protein